MEWGGGWASEVISPPPFKNKRGGAEKVLAMVIVGTQKFLGSFKF